jgi:putative ABC transport system permease protein
VTSLFRRLRWWLRRSDKEAELREELQFHLEAETEERQHDGLSQQAARFAARREMGNVTLVQENTRAVWIPVWLEQSFQELRHGLRRLWRDRGFTLAAIAMLALAIGLNVTAFTVMEAMLFRGYPLVQRNDELVYLQERAPARGGLSYADFEDWRAQATSFQGMSFIGEKRVQLREGTGRPSDQWTFTVSANLFGLLGVAPMLGRDFVPADEVRGAPPVVILNYQFWAGRFGKRTDLVGTRIEVDGAPATIIGVMPEHFDFPTQWNLWMPAIRSTERGLTAGGYTAVARLRTGVSARAARTELGTINRHLETAYPATNRGLVPLLVDNMHYHAGPNAPIIYGTLWAGACFVLLVACANLANLTLVRTIGRTREFETRLALGAGQGRMIQQVLMESLVLAAVAGTLGWWITSWVIRSWAAATASRYQILDYRVDTGTLTYLVTISVVAAILFSLVPIAKVVRLSASGSFSGNVRGATQGPGGRHLSRVLVGGQMALAIVLLSGAGVLVRSLITIITAETGVRDPDQVLTGVLELPSDKYAEAASRLTFFDRLELQLKSLPGIQDASVANRLPVFGINSQAFEIEGRPSPPDSADAAPFVAVGSDYFQVLGASALAGREFGDSDRAGAVPVALVNQSFADRFFPGEQPLGNRVRVKTRDQSREWRTVVGVVSNIMQGDATRQNFKPLVYVPVRQEPPKSAYFLLRADMDPDQVARAVRSEIQRLDSDLILEDFRTLKASFAFDGDNMDVEHMELGKDASAAPVFAFMALLLAAIGLYAVVAHSSSQRTREIGVRMAIGATAENIRGMILRDGLTPVAAGILLGLAASLAVNRVLQSQLVGVSPYDPLTMGGAPVVLLVVALVACQIPARRAMNVDPVVALRHD